MFLLSTLALAGTFENLDTYGFDYADGKVYGTDHIADCSTFITDTNPSHTLVISQPGSFAELFVWPIDWQTDMGIVVKDAGGNVVACDDDGLRAMPQGMVGRQPYVRFNTGAASMVDGQLVLDVFVGVYDDGSTSGTVQSGSSGSGTVDARYHVFATEPYSSGTSLAHYVDDKGVHVKADFEQKDISGYNNNGLTTNYSQIGRSGAENATNPCDVPDVKAWPYGHHTLNVDTVSNDWVLVDVTPSDDHDDLVLIVQEPDKTVSCWDDTADTPTEGLLTDPKAALQLDQKGEWTFYVVGFDDSAVGVEYTLMITQEM